MSVKMTLVCDRCGTSVVDAWTGDWKRLREVAAGDKLTDLCPKCAVEFGEWLDLKGDRDAGSAEH